MHLMTATFEDGSKLSLVRADNGLWRCPVCGFAGLDRPPYSADGEPSFQMCDRCEFEFGFDDSDLASKDVLKGEIANIARWRAELPRGKKRESLTDDLKLMDAEIGEGRKSLL